jgi:hypothetical protein
MVIVTPMGIAIAKYPTITAAMFLHMAGKYTPGMPVLEWKNQEAYLMMSE